MAPKSRLDANAYCYVCKTNEHFTFHCKTFNEWSNLQRRQYLNDNDICLNCLRSHPGEECNWKSYCRICNKKHNTKVHMDENDSIGQTVGMIQSDSKLLATALVNVKDKFGIKHILRVFIDQGSQGSFISERATQLLRLSRQSENVPLTGIDNTPIKNAKCSVKIQIESVIDTSFKMTLEALVIKTIIKPQNNSSFAYDQWNHLKGIPLADPEFLNPKYVDLLFGVDIHGITVLDGLRKDGLRKS